MQYEPMSAHWAQRLKERRARTFIGRTVERQQFRDIIKAKVLPFQVLAIVAPGGAGKTTLLKALASDCDALAVDAATLDGRAFQPNPNDFLAALRAALQVDAGDDLWQSVSGRERFVLFIDNYDALFSLNHWLCDAFFPRLLQDVLVVTASRRMLPEPWQHDPAWRALIHVQRLDNFSANESASYLALRGLPRAEHEKIIRFSHGHPLTLSLIADLYERQPDLAFEHATSPDVIQTIVRRLAGDVTDPMCRLALEACALVRVTTESLLCVMLDVPDAGKAFTWLYDLSFMDASPAGIYPHDLAREVLVRDLRWRHPERYDTFRRRAHEYFQKRLQHPDETVRHDALTDFLFLHRHHDVLDPLLGQGGGTAMLPQAERAARSDHTRIIELIEKHEGTEVARTAARWLALHPEGVRVVRNADGDVEAFIFIITLRMLAGELVVDGVDGTRPVRGIDDEIIQALCAYLLGDNPDGRTLLEEGQAVTVTRFGADDKTHQRPSPAVAALIVELVRDFITTPNVKFTFNVMAKPDEWETYARKLQFFQRLEPYEFVVGRLTFGVFMQDWRRESPQQWLARIAPDREWRPAPESEPAAFSTTEPTLNLPSQPSSERPFTSQTGPSQEEWLSHVRHALKHLHSPDVLIKNPLIHLVMVRKALSDGPSEGGSKTKPGTPTSLNVANTAMTITNVFGPAVALQRLIISTVQTFASQPDRVKFYNALYYTHIEPKGTQEQVAEFLDIPFSTYRGHLRGGVAALAAVLSELETYTRGS